VPSKTELAQRGVALRVIKLGMDTKKDSDKAGFPGPKAREDWHYYVQGTVNGILKQAKDPVIRSHAKGAIGARDHRRRTV